MHLSTIDLVIIALSILISFLPALFYYKRAGSSTTEFFTSGRAAPRRGGWWVFRWSLPPSVRIHPIS